MTIMENLQPFLDGLQADFPDAYRYVLECSQDKYIKGDWVERYLGGYIAKRFLAGERESLTPLLERICELAAWIELDILSSNKAKLYRVYSSGGTLEYVAGEEYFSGWLTLHHPWGEFNTLTQELLGILPPLLARGLKSYWCKQQLQIDREAGMY
jgi:hypothetical protein